MKYDMSATLCTITLLFILPLSSAAKKVVSDASGKACTSIVLSDRTIAYDFCFSTLTMSKSADLRSLYRVAVSLAQFQIQTILKKLNQLKDDADGKHKVDRYRTCLASYARLNGYVSIITAETSYGDAKRNLRNAITAARSAADKCEKQFTGSAGRQSPIAAEDKKVESLVKIAVKILNMVH